MSSDKPGRSFPVGFLLAGLVLALMPFHEPHLLKQWHNFQAGTLNQAMDIFDVLLHGGPLLLSIFYGIFLYTRRSRSASSEKN